jgi:peroxiredoxin
VIEPGEEAPGFTLPDQDARALTLSQLSGRPMKPADHAALALGALAA